MRIVTDEKDKKEYKEFLEKHERCNFQQSPEWAKVKSNWKNEIVLAEDERKKIIGAVSILIRKIPLFGNIMYSSRGPTADIHDISVMKQLTDGIKELAKKYNAIVYKAEPDILSSDEEFRKVVTNLGYKIKDDAKNFREEIQPRYVFRLDIKGKTEEEIMAGFHSKTRYNIRLATRKGVKLREGTKCDLDEFQKILETTGSRDGFYIRKKEYFEKFFDSFDEKHLKLVFAEYENKPISCVLNIFYGNKEWYLYGGSLNEHRNLMSTYLLQWEMIKQAIERNMDCYDFRGVCATDETHYNEGLYRFKKGFNADFVEFMDMHKIYNPVIYFLFEKCGYKLRDLKLKVSNIGKKK